MARRPLDSEDRQHLEKMLDLVTRGRAVLTAAEIHPDIPTTTDVGPRRRLNTPEPVRHLGYGLFKAGDFAFDGGGAMTPFDLRTRQKCSGSNMDRHKGTSATWMAKKLDRVAFPICAPPMMNF